MIFELEESCFQQEPKTFSLVELANVVLHGRHRLYVQDEINNHYSNWVTALPKDLSDIWLLALNLSMELEALEPAKITIKVSEASPPDHSSSPPILSVEQASRLAREPYRVFLENDDADRHFLLTFSDSHQKAKIEELESNNLIRFEHCGGIGELKKKVVKFAGKKTLYPAICTAVFDSDAPQPNDTSNQANAVLKVCGLIGVDVFMLKRRAIENYLLLSWLNTWVNRTRDKRKRYLSLFKNFCTLNKEQRAHFHMKNGLTADTAKVSDGTIHLYDNIEDDRLRLFATGFGSNVGSDLYSSQWVQDSHQSEDPEAWEEVNGIVKEFLVLCR